MTKRAGWLCAATCAAMMTYVLRGVRWELAFGSFGPDSWACSSTLLCHHALRLAWTLYLLAALTALGRVLLRPLALDWADRWEETGIAFSVGAGAWGSLLHLSGLAGLWSPALLASAAALGTWPLALWLKNLRSAPPRLRLPDDNLSRIAIAACVLILAYHLPLLLLPETFFDALNYHLAMPNLYLIRGRIGPTPENSYSGVPSIPMMLFGQALALDTWGVSARLLHFAFLPAVLVSLRGLAGRAGFAPAAPLACAIFALSPVVQGEALRTSTGLEWTLFQLTAFHALRAAMQSGRRRSWLVVAGSALGFAAASKYPAGAAALGAAAGMLYLAKRGERPFTRTEAAFVFGLAALWLAPWLVRNAVFYGNPIYPFLQDRLAPGSPWLPDWRRISEHALDPARLFSAEFLGSWLRHPLVWSRSQSEFGAALGPAFLGLLPAVFLARAGPGFAFWMVLLAASWIPLSLVVHDMTRYMVPGLAAWAALSAWAVHALPEKSRRLAAVAGLSAALAGGAAFLVMRLPAFADLDTVLGSRSFDEFMARPRPMASHYSPPHAAFAWVERHAAPGERALLIGDARHFPWRVDHLSSSDDQRSWLEVLADQSSDSADLARRLRGLRVRWIVMNRGEMANQRVVLKPSPRGAAAIKNFRLRPVFNVNDDGRWMEVYEVPGEDAQ